MQWPGAGGDGKGRALDNIFVGALMEKALNMKMFILRAMKPWAKLKSGLNEYFNYYNYKRHHSSIGQKCPEQVYSKNLRLAA